MFRRTLLTALFLALTSALFAGGRREPVPASGPSAPGLGVAPAASAAGASPAPGAAPASAYPLHVVDDSGTPVRLDAAPRRIVSLTVFTDDMLFDLVPVERLAAVSTFAADPDISNVADRAVQVAQKATLNVELILSLRPDLLFVANWSEADKVRQLRAAGVPVFRVDSALSVPSIQRQIRTVALLVGEPEKGEELIAGMDRRLESLQRRLASLPAGQRLSVLDYAVWGAAQGRGSSWDEVVRLAGLINAAAAYSADRWGQVPLSRERLLELDPDVLILPGWVYGKPGGAGAFQEQLLADPALQSLKAVRTGRVYRFPERLKTATSQYIVEAAEALARLAYPELFP